MSHIFISYSKQDIDFGRHLRQLLEKEGFVVWMDEIQLEPSERWWSEIEENIESCAAFIVIMSPIARESRWVEREILHAEDQDKPIFPVLLSGERWPRLAEIQYQDMSQPGLQARLPARLIASLKSAGVRIQISSTRMPPAAQPSQSLQAHLPHTDDSTRGSPGVRYPPNYAGSPPRTGNLPSGRRTQPNTFTGLVSCVLVLLMIICGAGGIYWGFQFIPDWVDRDDDSTGKDTLNAEPSIEVFSPLDGASYTLGQTITIRAQARSSEGITYVVVTANGLTIATEMAADDPAPTTFDVAVDYRLTQVGELELVLTPYRNTMAGDHAAVTISVVDDGVASPGPSLPPSATIPPSATYDATCRAHINQLLNFRTGPGTNYDIIANLSIGSEIPITGYAYQGEWWQLYYNERYGWVAAEYTTSQGDCDSISQVAIPPSPTPVATDPVWISPTTMVPTTPAPRTYSFNGTINFDMPTPNPLPPDHRVVLTQNTTISVAFTISSPRESCGLWWRIDGLTTAASYSGGHIRNTSYNYQTVSLPADQYDLQVGASLGGSCTGTQNYQVTVTVP